ncbi:MAG TPA: NAD(P)H-binding protein [Rhodopseudomonas sp.]|uniref:NAD(P)H-binding protein n=1 Tax=Rhodopseudomonas sp. TaxID=1078 RepID=UPI002ED8E5AB
MKVILFGATGMVGQGVLRECLRSAEVESLLVIGRSPTHRQVAKLHEILREDFLDFSDIESELTGYDACFFCLGVSSIGLNERHYRQLTYDITLAAARTLAKLNPASTFIYVSGRGTDSTEQGRLMWARVKGKTENDLLKLPFQAYLFRPGAIQPLHGIESKTRWINTVYRVGAPLWSWLNKVAPRYITTTEQLGRAMIKVARDGYPTPELESEDINKVAVVPANAGTHHP